MTDTERLEFLIDSEAYVQRGTWGWVVRRHIGDDEFDNLSDLRGTPRGAIDMAMGAE